IKCLISSVPPEPGGGLPVCSIEVVLGLEAPRRKVPETAREELRDGPFGSKVIRASVVLAAGAHGAVPHRGSLKGGLQTPPAFAEASPEGTPSRRRRLRGSLGSRPPTMRSGSAPTEWSKSPQHPPRPYPLPLDPRQEAQETSFMTCQGDRTWYSV